MRKFFISAVFALSVLCGYAQEYVDVDRVVIEIPAHFINNHSSLKEKFVKIFGAEYTIYVQNIQLSPNWFTADIIATNDKEGTWDIEEWSIEQVCKLEDKTADVHGNTSSCKPTLYQNYDFSISSVMHLLTPDDFGDIEIEYIIRDKRDPNTKFTLVLVFPYHKNTITGINDVQVEQQQQAEYYDLQGNRLPAPTHGIIIEKRGNKVSKKLYK